MSSRKPSVTFDDHGAGWYDKNDTRFAFFFSFLHHNSCRIFINTNTSKHILVAQVTWLYLHILTGDGGWWWITHLI